MESGHAAGWGRRSPGMRAHIELYARSGFAEGEIVRAPELGAGTMRDRPFPWSGMVEWPRKPNEKRRSRRPVRALRVGIVQSPR